MAASENVQIKAQSRIRPCLLFTSLVLGLVSVFSLRADELDELSLDGWKQLREVERYQLQIAEKYSREQNWKTAAGEYEKFLELYENSTGAPYAQLKWSLAQVKLRKQNTAIKEGFQTVIDYWPESPQAIAASYYLGRTLKEIGRLKEAKTALKAVVAKHPGNLAAVYALSDLAAIAESEGDAAGRSEVWKQLTFSIARNPTNTPACVAASQQLANFYFREGAFDDGVKALATSYDTVALPAHVAQFVRSPVYELVAQPDSKAKGQKLAEQAIAWFKQATPADRSTDALKLLARQALFAIADLTVLSARDEQVPAAHEAILQSFPGDDEALGKLAAWYKSKMNFDQARATFSRYAKANEGLGQVAYSFREQQNYPPAVQAYQQLIGQDAENKIRWKSELAATYRAMQKPVEAIAIYEELYKDDSAMSNRWRWEVACTYRDIGQYKEAIGHFRQCTNFPENYKQMAACHRQLKQPAEAAAVYQQIAAGDKASAPWSLLQIGYTREEAEQQEAAIGAFQQVCKKYPKDPHASVAHAHLQLKYKISVTLGGATEE